MTPDLAPHEPGPWLSELAAIVRGLAYTACLAWTVGPGLLQQLRADIRQFHEFEERFDAHPS